MGRGKIRVLIAKPGLDGHDRGAKVIANALRDAGMEVIYTGLRSRVDAIAKASVQEDVDVIGLSLLSGAHKTIVQNLAELLKKEQVDIPIVVGGVIPARDHEWLEDHGVKAIFGQDDDIDEVVSAVRRIARKEEGT